MATYEYHRMSRAKGIESSLLVGIVGSTALILAGLSDSETFIRALPGILAVLVIAAFLTQMIARASDDAFRAVSVTAFGPIYVALPLALGFQLMKPERLVVLFVILMVWATDTGAYYIGCKFGRHKLMPSLSPKKTWEGALGGVAACVLAALAFKRLVPAVSFSLGWGDVLVLGCLVSIFAELGDLAESALKRDAGVKDSGSAMRGHGGALDRLDSLLFAFAVTYVYLLATGHLGLPAPETLPYQ